MKSLTAKTSIKLSNEVTDSPRLTCFSDKVVPSELLINTFNLPDCTMKTLSSISPIFIRKQTIFFLLKTWNNGIVFDYFKKLTDFKQ